MGSGSHGTRGLFESIRDSVRAAHFDLIRHAMKSLSPWLADGEDVNPHRIRPVLWVVRTGKHERLFRIARLLDGLPPSPGFGRRIRFLVVDAGNPSPEGTPRLIGAIGLQSPPIAFPPRDRLFRYPPGMKRVRINQTMDIHTLTAVPPYCFLMAGKLLTMLAASNEVRLEYRQKYEGRRTVLNDTVIPPHLVALTVVTAPGRTSCYRGLAVGGFRLSELIGWTTGYGTFHLDPFYERLRAILRARGLLPRNGFEGGPRLKWQNITRALRMIGLSSEIMRHGIRLPVFLIRTVRNLEEFMENPGVSPDYLDLPADLLVETWKEKWLHPLLRRWDAWRRWRWENIWNPNGGSAG
ncbi:Druantia anti-phage system protein DruA [Thermoflexus sp.]|uniref:Druantia anti-phage system protein DruA n=1 Tax=Thermoflexus sp. TaxID=1969742 RepID=UPI002ADE005D|nr:Druantia anti-phage system protein DruA [Thermoflexus sp.]